MPRPPAMAILLTLLIAGMAGCSKSPPSGPLPNGQTLMSESSAAMREITSAHVAINAEGEVSNLPLRRAEGDLTREGNAKGTIQLQQFGALIEYEFVLLGDSIYLKGITGGWQKLPADVAATIYDPSAILDPDRGVAKLLATATDSVTEAQESIEGHDTYRVSAKLDSAAVAALVPGVADGITGKLWVDVQTKHLVRAIFSIPSTTPGKLGTVTVNLTDINKPVTVNAP